MESQPITSHLFTPRLWPDLPFDGGPEHKVRYDHCAANTAPTATRNAGKIADVALSPALNCPWSA